MVYRATKDDARILSEIGAETFIDSHKDSAPSYEIDIYVREKYNLHALNAELSGANNIIHIIKQGESIAGFSKLFINTSIPGLLPSNVSKLDQLYLLQRFHGLKLGAKLLQFNIGYAAHADQSGMWLVVWQGNDAAIRFYRKFGFEIIKRDFFQLTPTHKSPCQFMYLDFNCRK
jgi:ribosomal protein S18 acetylase RimI-like enzyme